MKLRKELLVIPIVALILTAAILAARASDGNLSLEVERISENKSLIIADDTASNGEAIEFSSQTVVDQPVLSCDTSGKELVPPAKDLAAIVASDPENTCYSLPAGTYTFHNVKPKNGMSFHGAGIGQTIVNGGSNPVAFFGNAEDVVISQMSIRDFKGYLDSPETLGFQAPIMGHLGMWLNERPEDRAQNWYITEIESTGSPASGISLGDYFTVTNSKFHGNTLTGIGGGNFFGGLVENNEIYNNGAGGGSGPDANFAGIKVIFVNEFNNETPFIIRNNDVHDNDRIGIWCDIDCRNVVIEDNTVYNHKWVCIYYEISRQAVIKNNTLTDCTTAFPSNYLNEWNFGALLVADSGYIEVTGNTITRASGGITVQQTVRPAPNETWFQGLVKAGRVPNRTAHHIDIDDNILIDVDMAGASHGLSAQSLTQYDTISFSGNNYEQSPGIALWFNRQQYTLEQWRDSLGFDE